MQDPNDIPELDEIALVRRDAFEAALRDMLDSGFGDLEPEIPRRRVLRPPICPKSSDLPLRNSPDQ